jgi:hypothetical protein
MLCFLQRARILNCRQLPPEPIPRVRDKTRNSCSMAKLTGPIEFRPTRKQLAKSIEAFLAEARTATESDFGQWCSVISAKKGFESGGARPTSNAEEALLWEWTKEES